MDVKYLKPFLNKLQYGRCLFMMLFSFFLFITTADCQTTRKQLSPASAVQKIAFIDHAKLRREYSAMKHARDSVMKAGREMDRKPASAATTEQWRKKRAAVMQTHEQKIMAAIGKVVSEGGYTDLRPLSGDSTRKGIDITDQVLKKIEF